MSVFSRCAEWYRRYGPRSTITTTYSTNLKPEARAHFDEAFVKMNDAIATMNKAFEAQNRAAGNPRTKDHNNG